MRLLILGIIIVFLNLSSNAQEIFISSSEHKLYSFNVADCSYTYVTQINNEAFDISFHPNGDLYGVSSIGELYTINIVTGATQNVFNMPPSFYPNALTIDANGIIYIAGAGSGMWTYDTNTNVGTNLGSSWFISAGDLTFYNGELYLAATGNQIIHINLENLNNSTVVIDDTIAGTIYGIVSYAEGCHDAIPYALTTNVYQIDFETSSFVFLCSLDILAYGGASYYEFLASSPVVLEEVNSIDPSGCEEVNGEINIVASGGNGELEYAVDCIDYQSSPHFTNLPAGEYTVCVRDTNGCVKEEQVLLVEANVPIFEDVQIEPAFCHLANGSLTVIAQGGIGALSYSIDGVNYQSSNVFSNLAEGVYTIYIQDEASCVKMTEANVHMLPVATITVATDTAYCNRASGQITVLVQEDGLFTFSLDGMIFQDGNTFSELWEGNYTVWVKDENDCVEQITVELPAKEPAFISDLSIQHTSCNQENGQITVLPSQPNVQYAINDSGFSSVFSFDNLATGNYTIYLMDEDNCIDTSHAVINESNSLLTEIEVSPVSCYAIDGAIYANVSGGVGEIEVSCPQLSPEVSNSYTDLPTGNYVLYITDEVGCEEQANVFVPIEDCEIYIPNSFSPNDDGINDNFQVYLPQGVEGIASSFQIFDRWGGLLYQDENVNLRDVRWNGKSDGQPMNMGVYVYVIDAYFLGGQTAFYSGDVFLSP